MLSLLSHPELFLSCMLQWYTSAYYSGCKLTIFLRYKKILVRVLKKKILGKSSLNSSFLIKEVRLLFTAGKRLAIKDDAHLWPPGLSSVLLWPPWDLDLSSSGVQLSHLKSGCDKIPISKAPGNVKWVSTLEARRPGSTEERARSGRFSVCRFLRAHQNTRKCWQC